MQQQQLVMHIKIQEIIIAHTETTQIFMFPRDHKKYKENI